MISFTIRQRARARRLAPGAILLAIMILAAGAALAQDDRPAPVVVGAPMHPTFPLLDAGGAQVQISGAPVSTMVTCGACHDADFIEEHSFHADLGLGSYEAPPADGVAGGPERAWDSSQGAFGKWDALTYRYLSPQGDKIVDLTTPEWVQLFGARHVGGGPASTSRDGRPLTALSPDAGDVETSIHDPETGDLAPWDWQASGVVEMNCFLCHTPNPDNEARQRMLATGRFGWANTATLAATGLVSEVDGAWQWNPDGFDGEGNLAAGFLGLQDPSSQSCGQCHGVVHVDPRQPLVTDACAPDEWNTMTTGQIISPQRLADSGLNLADKEALSRTWDVHAERVLDCTDCHYSLNNPVYYQEPAGTRPDHLVFDPRRIDLGEYLFRPLHQFAKGQSAQGTLAPELDNTQRRCESCHSIEATHQWLPYKDTHMGAVSCESCHIPALYAPARQYVDWTVLQADASPRTACRGVEGSEPGESNPLVSGYAPVLLPRADAGGGEKLAPFNLITSWFWVYGDPARPVPQRALTAAWLSGDGYHPDLVAAFDVDGDGRISDAELVIDSPAKETAVADRLTAQGLAAPRITGEVQPYSINHNVAEGEWVTRECGSCHGEASLAAQPALLADRLPGGVIPSLPENGVVSWNGQVAQGEDGVLRFQPTTRDAGLYVLGHDAVAVIDWAGALLFLGVLVGVTAHGGLRYMAARRMVRRQETAVQEVYMYDVYERLWHWLQTVAILLLLFTGLIIHKPDMFGVFSFSYVVQVHNVLAAILVVNAALSLFYHLVSGEIRQYLPRPKGFFSQAIEQAQFYLQGIFRRQAHPFEKSRQKKLNPLQQLTYFGILNVLLPLQIITGILMWGAQRWPELAARTGGLPFLAPFHTLVAWLFASFVVGHVYLTTTGHAPLASIKAMMLGWDEVEVHQQGSQAPAGATPAD